MLGEQSQEQDNIVDETKWHILDAGKFLGINRRVWAVWFGFISCGLLYSQFTSRMPAIKEGLNIDEKGIGILIMCFAAGSLAALLSSSYVLRFVQAKTALKVSVIVFMLTMVSIAYIDNYDLAKIIFIIWGFSCAYLGVGMNSQAMYLEMHTKSNYMAAMHANYSLGCVIGSIIASIFAFLNLSLAPNYLTIAVIDSILFILCVSKLYDDPPNSVTKPILQAGSEIEKRFSYKSLKDKLPLFIFLCGLMSLLSYTAEGSVAEWGGLVMYSTKGASEGLAALGYGLLACTMAITRFMVDRLRQRISDVTLMVGGASIAAFCMLTVIYTKDPYICLISYALMGIGIAPISPIAFSRAGASNLVSPKLASTIVTTIGYCGFLVLPPCLGYLASFVGLEYALFLPFSALIVVIISAYGFRKKQN